MINSLRVIHTPVNEEVILSLKAGDQILLNGTVYTARDAAHKRMVEALNRGEALPVQLDGQILFYAGPAPAPPGKIMGAVGPTTSSRMDDYTPELLSRGLKGMIGKGKRSSQVKEALKKYKAVYFGAIGGAAALLSRYIHTASVVAWPELGPEAIHQLELKDFPLLVINDCYGNDWYDIVTNDQENDDEEIVHSEGFRNFLHGVRSPISTLTEWLNAFLQGHVDADYFQNPERLTNIRNRAQSVLEMIDRYLLFEQTLVQKKEIISISLLPFMQSVLNFYALQAEENKIQLCLETSGKDLFVNANPLDMEILFSILIDNAVKYNVQGGKVTVSCKEDDSWYIVQIQDTGIGIQAKDIPLVFDAFYRTEDGRAKNLQGAGLGLSNARDIVHSYCGEIDIKDNKYNGTVVTVKFPKCECS